MSLDCAADHLTAAVRQSAKLRALSHDESAAAIERLVSLANKVAAATPGDEQLATLADLA